MPLNSAKKIKILRMIARLNIGGPSIHAVLLTEGLDKSRFQTLFICGNLDHSEGDMSYYALQKNIHPIFISQLRRKISFLNDPIAFIKIYKIIQREAPDIIHTHTAKAGTLGRLGGICYNLLHRRKKIKLVHTFHGHIFSGYFNKFSTRLFILIERFLARFTCKIISLSTSLKNDLVSRGICAAAKIEVLTLGLELDRFLNIPLRINKDVFHIGIIGRLVPVKNHRLFLEAAAEVIRSNPRINLRFKIIGDGESRGGLKEYADKLGLSSQIDFLGWQTALTEVYSELDIVALTSLNEGTPVSLIEAMASARSVIATAVGGVRDLLGKECMCGIIPDGNFRILERGIIVRPQDPVSFAKGLILLLSHAELREDLARRARDFVQERFTKDRLVRDIENLYQSILF